MNDHFSNSYMYVLLLLFDELLTVTVAYGKEWQYNYNKFSLITIIHGHFTHCAGSLWTIPPHKTRPVPRDRWKVLINRVHPATNKLLSPSKDERVCSRHFKDGRPTAENPYPTEHLGYPDFRNKVSTY